MPTVPTYEPRVQEQALPEVRIAPTAPIEAFGGGKPLEQEGAAAQGLASQARDIYLEEKKKADTVAAENADAAFSRLRNTLLWGSGNPADPEKGAYSQKGHAAFGTPSQYGEKFDKGASDILSGLSNDEQRAMATRYRYKQRAELDGSLQQHVFRESQAFQKDSADSGIATAKDDAVLNYQTPGKIEDALQKQKALLTSFAQANGMPPEKLDEQLRMTESGTHTAVVDRMLANSQVADAKAYYDANKAGFHGTDVSNTEQKLEKGITDIQKQDAWGQVQGMRQGDGTPDEAKQEAAIRARTDLPPHKIEEIVTYVKGRASEERSNKTHFEAANERTFMNAATTTRRQGGTMDDALKLASQYATDPYDRSIKEAAIRKMFGGPEESDPQAKYALWEGIQDGKVTNGQIDNAMVKDAVLSSKDWFSFKQEYFRINSEGKSPQMRIANNTVKQMAVASFGDDKEQIAEFMNVVHDASVGKTPEEMVKIATDKLKTDPNTQHHWVGITWGGDSQYQTDNATRTQEMQQFGEYQSDLGSETVRALKLGQQRLGKKSVKPDDLKAVFDELGGYENVKPGSPAHNAMQSLIQKGQPVVPANIKAVLEKHPDGVWK